jgi:hypothetical protein
MTPDIQIIHGRDFCGELSALNAMKDIWRWVSTSSSDINLLGCTLGNSVGVAGGSTPRLATNHPRTAVPSKNNTMPMMRKFFHTFHMAALGQVLSTKYTIKTNQ